MDENKKIAVITGGGQGIGKAIARVLLENNIKVIIAEIDEEAGIETENEYKTLGEIKFVKTDVADEQSVKDLVQSTVNIFGKPHILINNAGIFLSKPIEELLLEEWQRVISVNLTGAFLCAKYFSQYLRKNNGTIINISSTRAIMSEPNTESYSASKGGILALTHALAISLGPDIRVNCISPGWIEVGEWKKSSLRYTPQHSEMDKKQHPAGRVGRPEDIASLVLYLISDNASFITGANFVVDGGMTRKMIYV
jgi:NAD(P)-dependent dehydrogenase (short-subunit alcohol dehydrogenase family)